LSFWANVFLGKCLSEQTSFWANVFWANVFLGKCMSVVGCGQNGGVTMAVVLCCVKKDG
jgi:hypothetical protein